MCDHISLELPLLHLSQQGYGRHPSLALCAGTDGGIVFDHIGLELLLLRLSQQGYGSHPLLALCAGTDGGMVCGTRTATAASIAA